MQIRVFQIDHAEDEHRVMFEPLSSLKCRDVSVEPKIYKMIYRGVVNCHSLEEIYTKFNTKCPPDYCGHSLSISDIVEVVDNNDSKSSTVKPDIGCYFCDTFGFSKIDFDTAKAGYPEQLKVIVVEPLKKPYVAEIDTTLRAAQHVVDGNIDVVHSKKDQTLIVTNKYGETNKLLPNRSFRDNIIYGTFFVCGDGDENFRSLNDDEIDRYLKFFNEIEEFPEEDLYNTNFQMN